MSADGIFKTVPYAHQLVAWERFRDSNFFGLFFEQRCGKAKTTIDIAAHKYRQGQIDSLLIVAPNGVHRQWIVDQLKDHLPEDIPYRAALWEAGRIKVKAYRAELKELLDYTGGLRVLAINVDAVDTAEFSGRVPKDPGAFANTFFKGHRVMTVIDESGDIGNAGAKRSKACVRLGRVSRVRAILDGTPVAAGPLALYGQCEFLAPECLGFKSFFAFKAHYAELVRKDFGERDRPCPDCKREELAMRDCERCRGTGWVGKTEARVVAVDEETGVKRYRNLDELQGKLNVLSMRVLRSECADLPPKIYNKIWFDLDAEQRRTYDQLRETFRVELRAGKILTAQHVLTRWLRLQQVASGFLPLPAEVTECPQCHGTDDGCPTCGGLGYLEGEPTGEVVTVGSPTRLNALLAQVLPLATPGLLPAPGIVWCKFDRDVDAVVAAARGAGRRVVQYDGRVTAAAKAEAVRAFQAGEADLFVSKARSAGRGHDLARADWVAYFSHSWSLRDRLQSEDRAQSLKKTTATAYFDVVAADTVDERIVAALRAGKNLSDVITGDPKEEWL
jgi:SNF2-related domain/Helicase conserved C-terminal domain